MSAAISGVIAIVTEQRPSPHVASLMRAKGSQLL
jgi:hypothetical protein